MESGGRVRMSTWACLDVDALQWFELPAEELVQRMLRFVYSQLHKKTATPEAEVKFIEEQIEACRPWW